MALLSEDREKTSEARQFRFANNLFDAKTVFPFCASGICVVSPLPYAVVDSATLHNLKEAPVIRMVGPFTGADLCKHRFAEHRDGGPSFNTIRPLLRQPAGLNLYRAGILPANLYLLTTSAFTFTGCGLQRQWLCCRVAVKLHQPVILKHCTRPVRHFNRAERESDAHSPFDLHQTTQLRQLMAGF